MNTWTMKGPGRKRCPAAGCNLYVGVRARACTCGHEFGAAKTGPRRYSRFQAKPGEPKRESGPDRRPVLSVPAGICPIELEGTDIDTVGVWVDAVRAAHPGVRLTTGALRYYLRQFFPMFSDDYETAAAQL